ncbi:MAG: arylsulfatase [Phycisphaeraceae bacterium]|nr:arylsulfatase [Phycisphaeraceae bacterium]
MIQRLITVALLTIALPSLADERPNVILILTDDQGYGDIAALGNPVLRTPNMDKLHSESIRLTDYHVDPTCSPTRAALLTGRYSTRTGVWHTINGRSLMHGDEYTLAEYFKDNGYRTGMFGKWHLGSNAPLRPMDQGFEHCVWSPGGAVDQGGNYLGNDCFDDTYKVNEKWQKFPGYHTDVWYDQAMKFIEDTDTHGDEPFFVYLPTTAVHDPWNVDDEYAKPYLDAGVPPTMAKFYGMITNIDDNLGKLRRFLDDKGLAEDTILIYTTDNGTTAGWIDRKSDFKYFGAGMRGWKGSQYEGGHRVPFLMHWPAANMKDGRDVDLLLAHIDVIPTLGELCRHNPIAKDKLIRGPQDGRSFAWYILPIVPSDPPTKDRTLFVHVQRKYIPPKWDKSVAMTERWRLVNGKELYDITKDPGQENDIAVDHADVVEQLRADYEKWWTSLEPSFDDVVRFDLGGAENPTTLMSHDWFMKEGEGDSAWHHVYVQRNELRNGPFMVDVKKAGKYRITPMRWPEYVDKASGCVESDIKIEYEGAGVPINVERSGTPLDPAKRTDKSHGRIKLLYKGPAKLTCTFTREDGKTFGAYYVKIEYLGEE